MLSTRVTGVTTPRIIKQWAIPEWIIDTTTPQSTHDVLSITKAA
jgi:hypothetical protein